MFQESGDFQVQKARQESNVAMTAAFVGSLFVHVLNSSEFQIALVKVQRSLLFELTEDLGTN